MRRRDYFAAHAPRVPKWFNPELPPRPKHPGYLTDIFGRSSTHPDWEMLEYFDKENDKWYDEQPGWSEEEWINFTGKITKPTAEFRKAVNEHVFKINQYIKEYNKWEEIERIQKILQWRWFYADEMIRCEENLYLKRKSTAKKVIKAHLMSVLTSFTRTCINLQIKNGNEQKSN